jgi:endonuclease YncB( thermonuclease family)
MLRRKALLVILVLAFPTVCHALTGKVISIADGDTITILDNTKTQHKIRLYGIDTPEKKQVFGKAAKKYTASLTAGKTVNVTTYDTDRYGRTVGVVQVNGLNLNRKLIEGQNSLLVGKHGDTFLYL